MGLTVTQLSFDFGGSNPSLPTENLRNLISEVFCFMSFRVSDYPMKDRSVKSFISLTPISENTLFPKNTYNILIYINIQPVLRFKFKHKKPFFLFISDIFSEQLSVNSPVPIRSSSGAYPFFFWCLPVFHIMLTQYNRITILQKKKCVRNFNKKKE